MILSELKHYLAERRRAPMSDLVSRFEVEPDALRGMLQHLLRKGRVRRLDTGGCGPCGGCCATPAPEIYEWVE